MIRIVYILFIIICFQQNDIVQCQRRRRDNSFDLDDFNLDNILDEWHKKLNNHFNGITYSRSSLPLNFISDSGWIDSNQYFLKFSPETKHIFARKFFVGSLQRVNHIQTVILAFYDHNDNIIKDEYGQLLEYTARRHDLGYVFEILQRNLNYAYARFLLKLQPNSAFDPNYFFLHYAQSSIEKFQSTTPSDSHLDDTNLVDGYSDSSSRIFETTTLNSAGVFNDISSTDSTRSPSNIQNIFNSSSETIDGPNIVYVLEENTFNTSCSCPTNAFCLWMLNDNDTSISFKQTNFINLKFRPNEIGDHILSYTAIINNSYINLCIHCITVKPKLASAYSLNPITNSTVGLWNTFAGGDSKFSQSGSASWIQSLPPGRYNEHEPPEYAFDRNINSKYTSYGSCNGQPVWKNNQCGINTGLQTTLGSHSSLLIAFRFCTADDLFERDPIRITIEGSNAVSNSLVHGSSWTVIYNGSTGLLQIPGRRVWGSIKEIPDNQKWFSSYRILVTEKRRSSSAVQYAEVELLGYYY